MSRNKRQYTTNTPLFVFVCTAVWGRWFVSCWDDGSGERLVVVGRDIAVAGVRVCVYTVEE